MRKAITFIKAVATGRKVEQSLADERYKICVSCEHFGTDRKNIHYCKLCGCTVANDRNKIKNLISYVENLPVWGCKHPQRKAGKGWKR